MPVKFPCSACGRDVYSTKAPGETARCACGAEVPVPDDARAITYVCRTCGARGPDPTCGECGGSASPARLGAPDGPEDASPSPGTAPRRAAPRYHDTEAFQVRQVFGRGLRIWAANLLIFVPLSLLFFAPYLAYVIWAAAQGTDVLDPESIEGSQADAVWGFVVAAVIAGLLNQVVTGSIIFSVVQALREREVRLVAAIQRGLAALPAVIGVSVVMVLMIGAAVALVMLPTMLLAQTGLGPLFTVVAFLGLGVFVVWFMVRVWVVVPVVVVERPGVIESIKRSFRLSEGFRWRILGLIVLLAVFNWVVSWVSGTLDWEGVPHGSAVASVVVQAVLVSIGAVVTGVGYHDLRVAGEGVDVEDLAAVFE